MGSCSMRVDSSYRGPFFWLIFASSSSELESESKSCCSSSSTPWSPISIKEDSGEHFYVLACYLKGESPCFLDSVLLSSSRLGWQWADKFVRIHRHSRSLLLVCPPWFDGGKWAICPWRIALFARLKLVGQQKKVSIFFTGNFRFKFSSSFMRKANELRLTRLINLNPMSKFR